jgi:hypothetical protein
MKKAIVILLLLCKSFSAKSDVIYFPYQYALFCYSIEGVFNYEIAKKPKNTTSIWIGAGCVGSFFYIGQPFFGIECAIERRHYFKSDEFKKFFISGYIGTAYVSDFKDLSSLGIIPGFKINYKSQNEPKTLVEPYLGLSFPISFNLEASVMNYTFPVLTVGVRFGGSKLKIRLRPET